MCFLILLSISKIHEENKQTRTQTFLVFFSKVENKYYGDLNISRIIKSQPASELRGTAMRAPVKRLNSAGKLAKTRPVHEQTSRKVHLRVQILLGGQFPEQLREGLQGPFDHASPRDVRERRGGGDLRGGHLRGAGRQDLPGQLRYGSD